MNSPTPLPPPLPPRAEPLGTLEERIALAEQRLAARERWVQQAGQGLVQRLCKATEPRRLVWPALGGVLVLLLGFGLLRRISRTSAHLPRPAAPQVPSAAVAAPGLRDMPWVRAAGLLWPMLPAAWRGWIGPGTASLFVAVGLPLIELLFRRHRSPTAAPAPFAAERT